MAKWWQAPKTEEELLNRLYNMTYGFFAGGDVGMIETIPWGGYEEAQERATKPTYLRKYRSDIMLRIGKYGLFPVPGAQFVALPKKLHYNYGAMAGAAWACGYRKGVGPKDRREAQYDLLAITTVWAQQRQKELDWTDVAGLPMQDTSSITGFGKRFVYVLGRNGMLRVGNRAFGNVLGPLSAVAFSDEILPVIGEELFRLFKDELFSGMLDEAVPGVASVTSVARAWKRVDLFHDLAQKYYDFKASKLR